jgi:ABC-type spermidine/putrescine transport system permease subunit II
VNAMTRGKWLAALCLVPFTLFFIVFEIAPLVWVMINSLESEEFGWGLANFSKIFNSKFYLQAIQYSLEISFWSSVFGIIIAVLGAYSLRRVDSKLRNFVNAFANMTSNFAGVPLAFAFIILLGFNGSFTIMLKQAGIIQDFNLYSKTGLIILYTYFQIPLGVLLLYPAFDALREDWRESAELLGANGLAILASHRFAGTDPGAARHLRDPAGQRPWRLRHGVCPDHRQLQRAADSYRGDGVRRHFPGPEPGQCFGGGAGGLDDPRDHRASAAVEEELPCLALNWAPSVIYHRVVVYLLFAILLLPLLGTFIYSISSSWSATILPSGFSLKWYAQLWSDPRFLNAFGQSLLVCIGALILSVVLILPLLFVVHYHFPKLDALMNILILLPFAVPPVVSSVGLLQLYGSGPFAMVGTPWILIGCYFTVALPFMYRAITNNLQAINLRDLMDAAQLLGASTFQAAIPGGAAEPAQGLDGGVAAVVLVPVR